MLKISLKALDFIEKESPSIGSMIINQASLAQQTTPYFIMHLECIALSISRNCLDGNSDNGYHLPRGISRTTRQSAGGQSWPRSPSTFI